MIKWIIRAFKRLFTRQKKQDSALVLWNEQPKDFFDCVLPGTIRFFTDHYIVGDTYRCAWAIREYPPVTSDFAILGQIGDKGGVTLRVYHRIVPTLEADKLCNNAQRRNRLKFESNDIKETIEAEGNIQDVSDMLSEQRITSGMLLHVAVFIELKARSLDELHELQSDISMALMHAKITIDRLTLRQLPGFKSVVPTGSNQFGTEFERVIPASSAANLFPFNYSGKRDPNGMYIGKDKFGSNIIVDFERRADDKTNSNILILGNSGQGKSYLMKLILTNLRESGKSIIILDPESEYEELCRALGGSYIDFMSGRFRINPLEPKVWSDGDEVVATTLSQHISFLKSLFGSYRSFNDGHLAAIEMLLTELYKRFSITDETDLGALTSTDYPIMQDFYELCEEEFYNRNSDVHKFYTTEQLRYICLGIHSMCVGSDKVYFNGHTNIADGKFIVFGVKGLLETNQRLKDTLLFNIFSYMSSQLLGKGNTVASIDELYLCVATRCRI